MDILLRADLLRLRPINAGSHGAVNHIIIFAV